MPLLRARGSLTGLRACAKPHPPPSLLRRRTERGVARDPSLHTHTPVASRGPGVRIVPSAARAKKRTRRHERHFKRSQSRPSVSRARGRERTRPPERPCPATASPAAAEQGLPRTRSAASARGQAIPAGGQSRESAHGAPRTLHARVRLHRGGGVLFPKVSSSPSRFRGASFRARAWPRASARAHRVMGPGSRQFFDQGILRGWRSRDPPFPFGE